MKAAPRKEKTQVEHVSIRLKISSTTFLRKVGPCAVELGEDREGRSLVLTFAKPDIPQPSRVLSWTGERGNRGGEDVRTFAIADEDGLDLHDL